MGRHSRWPLRERSGTPRGEVVETFTIPDHDAQRATRMIHKGCPILPRHIASRRLLPMAPAEFGRSLLLMASVVFFPALRAIGLA